MTPGNELLKLYNSLENKRSILNILRNKKYSNIVNFLNDKYPMLADNRYSFGMKIFWFVNNLNDFPPCVECGKPNMTHRCGINGYYTNYCSAKCSNGNNKLANMKETFIEKYGVDNPLKNDTVKKKQIDTTLEKYGVRNISLLDSTIQKISNTKSEKYGDPYFTNLEKTRNTILKKYGVDNVFQLAEIQQKTRDTLLKKYGVEHPMQSDIIKQKMTDKMSHYAIHNSYANYLAVNPYSEPNFSEEYYFQNRKSLDEFEFKCRKCGKIFSSRIHNGTIRRCPICYSSVTTSGSEQEIFDFISNNYSGLIIRKDRTVLDGKELDFYLPNLKLAIEFDGLYWHSELNGIDKKYHISKTRHCEDKGIQLLHIFEDEWENKQEIVKSKLLSLIGVYQTKIFARKCSIVEVSKIDEMNFLEQNHIQGYAISSYCYGLMFNGELVALMNFVKPRIALGGKNKTGVYELLRFCVKRNYHVVGAAGKLLKHFEKNVHPTELISYADRRWSVGKLYRATGFRLDHISPPNYWYLNNGCSVREHRFSFRKSLLKKKLNIYDENLTEVENMRLNKYTRIFDCGNLVFIKTYNN